MILSLTFGTRSIICRFFICELSAQFLSCLELFKLLYIFIFKLLLLFNVACVLRYSIWLTYHWFISHVYCTLTIFSGVISVKNTLDRRISMILLIHFSVLEFELAFWVSNIILDSFAICLGRTKGQIINTLLLIDIKVALAFNRADCNCLDLVLSESSCLTPC